MKKITKIMLLSVIVATASIGLYQSQPTSADPPTETIQTLDYIEFDGASYIDTGIDQLGDIKVEIDYRFTRSHLNTGTGSQWVGTLFGTRETSTNDIFVVYDPANGRYGQIDLGYGTTWWKSNIPTDAARHTIALDNNEFYYDGTLEHTFAPYSFTVPVSIRLGALWQTAGEVGAANNRLEGYVYSFKIWKDGNLARDFVPAARYVCGENATVEYGFIDRANGDAWYGTSPDTGTLTGSPTVLDTTCPVIPSTPDPTDPLIPGVPNAGLKR